MYVCIYYLQVCVVCILMVKNKGTVFKCPKFGKYLQSGHSSKRIEKILPGAWNVIRSYSNLNLVINLTLWWLQES